MNNRERALAILRYQDYDKMPLVHFGYWRETLEKWGQEGHIEKGLDKEWRDSNDIDTMISNKLGFDFNWSNCYGGKRFLQPSFQRKVLEELGDGARKVLNWDGVVVLEKDGAGSIPAEIDHTLKDRKSWEEHYLPRLQYFSNRVDYNEIMAYKPPEERDAPLGLHVGSFYGFVRNIAGIVGLSYLALDDEELYKEIIDTVGQLQYDVAKRALESGQTFDFGHIWEDICFKNGPLVSPSAFDKFVGPHYKKIKELLLSYDIDLLSLDCDGKIDALIPTWINNGVNIMFPIEVGTWDASIAPWREKYGKDLRGVGGMNKVVFSRDYKAVDEEIERLKPLVDLGGFIPCPDHRIAPDAKWENVQYYCEQMRKEFG
ncbi:MAG: hypothetical protein KAG94_05970 [Clostridiales bacterium]|nr:hypothetical protein [Clostridiales bacterium]